MKKKKRVACMIVVMLLGMTSGVIGTRAYLQAQTETKTNAFTSNQNISIQLREPAWDGFTFDDAASDGTKVNDSLDVDEQKKLGLVQAAAYVPGQMIPKNPKIKNDGTKESGVSARVALKVQYYDENHHEITYEKFKAAYLNENGITFDEKWKRINNSPYEVYLYEDVLGTGESTDALFSEIPLSGRITVGENGKLPGFQIRVTAYAVQAEYTDGTELEEIMNQFVSKNE